jgi:mannosyltransferase
VSGRLLASVGEGTLLDFRRADTMTEEAAAATPVQRSGQRTAPSSTTGLLLAALSLLLLVAWTVHWHTFSRLELGLDGALSVDLARSPLGELFAFSARDVHPPLFYLLLKYWLDLSGVHYFTAKYIAIAGSLPALPLLYQFARRLLPAWPALVAMLLLAVAPTTLLLSPTVRDFGLGLTFSLATVVLTLMLGLDRNLPTRRRALLPGALAALSAAALLTWYFHLFVLAAEALVLPRLRHRPAIGLALGAGCLAALPWYLYFLPHVVGKLAHGTTTFGSAPRLPNGLQAVDGALRALFGQPMAAATVVAGLAWLILLALGALVIARGLPDRSDSTPRSSPAIGRACASALLVLALALGTLEVAVTTLRWGDIGSLGRYVLPLLPFTSVLQAAVIVARPCWWRWLGLVGLVVVVPVQLSWFGALVGSAPIDWSHDPALAYVAAHARAGDGILFNDRARRALPPGRRDSADCGGT